MGCLNSLGRVMVAQFILWLFLNIGVPIFAPMSILVSLSAVFGAHESRAMLRDAIDDGQLYWTAIGLCAAGLYEVLTANSGGVWPAAFCTALVLLYAFVGVVATVVIVGSVAGQAFNRDLRRVLALTPDLVLGKKQYASLSAVGRIQSPDTFVRWSMGLVGLSAFACAGFHFASVIWPESL